MTTVYINNKREPIGRLKSIEPAILSPTTWISEKHSMSGMAKYNLCHLVTGNWATANLHGTSLRHWLPLRREVES
jgi:hypothetical protein